MPEEQESSGNMANRVTLTLVFTLSFLSYMTEDLNTSIQLLPLALFAALVFFKVFCSKSIIDALGSLFELDGVLYVLFVSLLTIASSLASGIGRSFETAVVISLCLILARVYMAVVPIQEVLEAFFWSGIVSIAIFVSLSFVGFMQSLETLARFTIFSFHPNLLAFVLAGYLCAMVWKFLVGNWQMKLLTAVVGFIYAIIIFFASSRGSIVSILVGGLFAVATAIMGADKKTRRKVLRSASLASAALLCLFLFVQSRPWVRDSYNFVDQVLQLTQDQRGLDSGLTGRFDKWHTTLRVLSDGTWFFGHGIRSSDSMEDNFIDNSYLVVLYETGLVTLVLISWRFVDVSRRFVNNYFRCQDKVQRIFLLSCALVLIVFMTNNIVARFLFSVGNPYSLFGVLLYATPTRLLASTSSAREFDGQLMYPVRAQTQGLS